MLKKILLMTQDLITNLMLLSKQSYVSPVIFTHLWGFYFLCHNTKLLCNILKIWWQNQCPRSANTLSRICSQMLRFLLGAMHTKVHARLGLKTFTPNFRPSWGFFKACLVSQTDSYEMQFDYKIYINPLSSHSGSASTSKRPDTVTLMDLPQNCPMWDNYIF